MADYVAYLTNCITSGAEFTTEGTRRTRNLTRLTLDGFNIELVQSPEVMSLNSLSNLVGSLLPAPGGEERGCGSEQRDGARLGNGAGAE